MSDLISIDPGVQACGVAYWHDGRLHAVEFRSAPLEATDVATVVEHMVVYPGGRFAQDLIDVAFAAGRMTSACSTVRKVTAREWKGQIPRNIEQLRTTAKLTAEEMAVYTRDTASVKPYLRHNVISAIGIGLWSLGR